MNVEDGEPDTGENLAEATSPAQSAGSAETRNAAAAQAAISPAAVTADASALPPGVTPEVEVHEEAAPRPTLALEYKHPLAIRWMHWINFPLLGLMIYSGLLIYWADSQHEGLNAHQVYRVGWGNWTLFRLFPDGFYSKLNLQFKLASGMGYHYFFMWFFALNGLLYVLYTMFSGEWRYLLPNRNSFREAIQVTLYDLGLSKLHPPRRKFNGGQQFAYTGVVLMGAGSLLSGLAIYKPTQLHPLTSLLGGYEMARWLHFWLTMGYVAFFVVHVAQVVRAGWNNFRSMMIGYEVVSLPAVPSVSLDKVPHGQDAASH